MEIESEITKEEFDRYELVRLSGLYNMIMNAHDAMMAAALYRDKYLEIQKNYTALKEKFYGK